MADFYVRSTDGNDSDNGTTWALAKATTHPTTGAISVMAAGDTLYVSDNHNENMASGGTRAYPGTPAAPNRILCVDDTGDPQPPTALSTGGRFHVSGLNVTIHGVLYCNGCTWEVTGGSNSLLFSPGLTGNYQTFENCTFVFGFMYVGADSSAVSGTLVTWKNCGVQCQSTSTTILPRSDLEWTDTSTAFIGATLPNILFTANSAQQGTILVRGVDLSQLGSGKTLVSLGAGSRTIFRFVNCKLNSAVTLTTGTATSWGGGPEVYFEDCFTDDTQVFYYSKTYLGENQNDLVVYRAGGAEQTRNGAAIPYSLKLTSTANTKFWAPLQSAWCAPVYVTTTGSKTIKLNVLVDATLNNDEAWIEAWVHDTADNPISRPKTDAKANILATAAAQTSETTSDWDNGVTARANSTAYSLGNLRKPTGGGVFIVITAGTSAASEPGGFGTANDGDTVVDGGVTWRKLRRYELSVTATVNTQGWVHGRAMLAKVSTTVYLDPRLSVT